MCTFIKSYDILYIRKGNNKSLKGNIMKKEILIKETTLKGRNEEIIIKGFNMRRTL